MGRNHTQKKTILCVCLPLSCLITFFNSKKCFKVCNYRMCAFASEVLVYKLPFHLMLIYKRFLFYKMERWLVGGCTFLMFNYNVVHYQICILIFHCCWTLYWNLTPICGAIKVSLFQIVSENLGLVKTTLNLNMKHICFWVGYFRG